MTRFHLVLAALLFALLSPAAMAAPPSKDDAARVEQLVRERLAASARGDKATWRRHIADDCVWVGPGLVIGTTADAESEQIGSKETFLYKDFETHAFGDIVVVAYMSLASSKKDGVTNVRRWRKADTYRRSGDAWKMIQAVEIVVPMRLAAKIDPRVLDDYVGTYRLKAGVELRVWREGEQLMMQATGQDAGPTFPAGNDVFFDDGEHGEYRFVRDGSRKVIAVVYVNEGLELRLERVAP